jgi:hypothetical protein
LLNSIWYDFNHNRVGLLLYKFCWFGCWIYVLSLRSFFHHQSFTYWIFLNKILNETKRLSHIVFWPSPLRCFCIFLMSIFLIYFISILLIANSWLLSGKKIGLEFETSRVRILLVPFEEDICKIHLWALSPKNLLAHDRTMDYRGRIVGKANKLANSLYLIWVYYEENKMLNKFLVLWIFEMSRFELQTLHLFTLTVNCSH